MSAEMRDFLELIVRLAYQFGPFLFAVLFMLVITKSAHQYNVELAGRQIRPTPREEAMYQAYFVCTAACGVILVFISVGWWIISQMQSHVYEFVIRDLKINQFVRSSDGFMQDEKRDAAFPGGPLFHNQHFVIVSDRPFVPGQAIKLQLWETDAQGSAGGIGQPQSHDLQVQYRGDRVDYLRYEEQNHKLEYANTVDVRFGAMPLGMRSIMASTVIPQVTGHD
jgi:hypothetical protein